MKKDDALLMVALLVMGISFYLQVFLHQYTFLDYLWGVLLFVWGLRFVVFNSRKRMEATA